MKPKVTDNKRGTMGAREPLKPCSVAGITHEHKALTSATEAVQYDD